jgi:hypothetical protein
MVIGTNRVFANATPHCECVICVIDMRRAWMTDLPKSETQVAYEEWQTARTEYMRLMHEHIAGTPHMFDEFLPLIKRMDETMVRLMELVKPGINWKK